MSFVPPSSTSLDWTVECDPMQFVRMSLRAITVAVLLCSQATAQDTLIIQAVAQPVADEAKPEPQKDDAKKEDTKKDKPAEAAKDNKDKKPTDKPAKDAEADAKKRNAAERRKALVQRKAGPAAVQNTIEQQMHKQLEPMLKTEISFAARAAELNDDERRALIIAGKKWFDSFVADFVKNQDPNQQQMLLQGGQMMWFGGPQRKISRPARGHSKRTSKSRHIHPHQRKGPSLRRRKQKARGIHPQGWHR